MDGIAVKPLTVDFHEGGFQSKLNQENGLGFWFQLSDEQRQQAGSPWGPANAQALNRYSYVQNNPLKWTDPTGHDTTLTLKYDESDTDDFDRTEAGRFKEYFDSHANDLWNAGLFLLGASVTAGLAAGALLDASKSTIFGATVLGIGLGGLATKVVQDALTVSGMMNHALGYLHKHGGGQMRITIRDDNTVLVEAFSNKPDSTNNYYHGEALHMINPSALYIKSLVSGYVCSAACA